VAQETDLVGVAPLAKELDRLGQRHLLLAEGEIGLGQLPHPTLKELEFGPAELRAAADLAEIAARRHRMVDREPCPREEIFERGRQEKGQGTPVDAHPIGLAEGDRPQPGFHLDRVGQFTELAVDDSADNRLRKAVQVPDELLERGSARTFKHPTVW
jgi:hypothetical protein